MKLRSFVRTSFAMALGIGALTSVNAVADPGGDASGYWAGRLCDHVGPTIGSMTY